VPREYAGRGRYRCRSGVAWAGFLRAAPLLLLDWHGKLDGQQVPEHDTKRATQPIFVNLARALECQDRRKTAPSAALKKPRRFPSLAARFFTICLNSKKSRRS